MALVYSQVVPEALLALIAAIGVALLLRTSKGRRRPTRKIRRVRTE
jgi:HAMP domain-containing protein